MAWTKEQQQVIESRNCNLLVSAAAGSGKTAVLVERIITMLMDKNHKVDIDRLLIVTFTKAAAAEMKERIGQAIEEKLLMFPTNEHLNRQLSLIHKAQITTIHSFCLSVIRDNFNQVNLDPNFRIGDEAELSLLKGEVAAKVLEDLYQNPTEDFLALVESYSTGKSDAAIEEIILQVYDFARSYPRPQEWLKEAKKGFVIESTDQLQDSPWMISLLSYLKTVLSEARDSLYLALEICRQPTGPMHYEVTIRDDISVVEALMNGRSYEQYNDLFAEYRFKRLAGKGSKEDDEEKKELVKSLRGKVKDLIGSLKKKYFYQDVLGLLQDIQIVKSPMNALIQAVEVFSQEYDEKKRKKNMVDFNDLEHFALNLLIKEYDESGQGVASDIAKELSGYYEEILIDEYQDSNLIQEDILQSVSKKSIGSNNVFMVGDVKQSIYKFRLARPDLFLDKYNKYTDTESDNRKIELKKNFRSRAEVLGAGNFIFYQIMRSELGDIEYNKEVALIPGLEFEQSEELTGGNTELYLVDLSKTQEDSKEKLMDDASLEYSKKELEGKAIAKRIKELIHGDNPQYVFDKNKKQYRKAEYKDIVILLRTVFEWADVFCEVLLNEGIPAHSDSQKGYFKAIEIQIILSLLAVVDNRYLDIQMAAVLRSPMVGITGSQLADIKTMAKSINKESRNFYTYIELYIEKGSNQELIEKLETFIELLNDLRTARTYSSIYELINMALDKTGYYHFVGAMPQGKKRQANIRMLMEKGRQYESTSYKGLFNFVRYMNQLKDYDVDFGEAKILGEDENLVRIMSIHKSKGLEFPIVFVSGLSKQFNTMDENSRIVIHPDFYIGPDCIDFNLRTKVPTLMKKVLQRTIHLEILGEELRILYVAMTRAREKLILTGTIDKFKEKLNSFGEIRYDKNEKISYSTLTQAKSYLDWIISALIRHKDFSHILNMYGLSQGEQISFEPEIEHFDVFIQTIQDVVMEEIVDVIDKKLQKEEFLNKTSEPLNQELNQIIEERFDWIYPFQKEIEGKVKLSVSELKKMGQNIEQEEATLLIKEPKEAIIPQFIQKQQPITSVAKGTAVHKILELLDFANLSTKESLIRAVDQLYEQSVIKKELYEIIPMDEIYNLLQSPLGNRIKNAAIHNNLFKETQYVLGVPMSKVDKTSDSSEMVLIQGIIDLYFKEDDGLVIVDYKTDQVYSEEILKERYTVQLEYYKDALEQLTGQVVKESYIYSLTMGRDIKT